MFFTSNSLEDETFADVYDYDPNTEKSSDKNEFDRKSFAVEKEVKFSYDDCYKSII